MDRCNLLHIIKRIIIDFEPFSNLVQNENFEAIESYLLPDNFIYPNDELKECILVEHDLLQSKTASVLYEQLSSLITYMHYIRHKITIPKLKSQALVISGACIDFMSFTEKLIRIEARRFLANLNRYPEPPTSDQIKTIVSDFSLSKEEYDYLIGYDIFPESSEGFTQICFFEETKKNQEELKVDFISGTRRIAFNKKINSDLKKVAPVIFFSTEQQEIVRNYLPTVSFYYVRQEYEIWTKRKTWEESDGYKYYDEELKQLIKRG